MAQATVKRTKLGVPTIDDFERQIYMIEYRTGELPPRFLYIPVKEWTKEKEVELIKADIKKRLETPVETIEL